MNQWYVTYILLYSYVFSSLKTTQHKSHFHHLHFIFIHMYKIEIHIIIICRLHPDLLLSHSTTRHTSFILLLPLSSNAAAHSDGKDCWHDVGLTSDDIRPTSCQQPCYLERGTDQFLACVGYYQMAKTRSTFVRRWSNTVALKRLSDADPTQWHWNNVQTTLILKTWLSFNRPFSLNS